MPKRSPLPAFLPLVILLLSVSARLAAQVPPPDPRWQEAAGPILECIGGAPAPWALQADVTVGGKKAVNARVLVERPRDDAYRVTLTLPEGAAVFERSATSTRLVVPGKVVFAGDGSADPAQLMLRPEGLPGRLVSGDTLVAPIRAALAVAEPRAAAGILYTLTGLHPVERSDDAAVWRSGLIQLRAQAIDGGLLIRREDVSVSLRRVEPKDLSPQPSVDLPVRRVDRVELERTAGRALRRALEVLLPHPGLSAPAVERQVPNGKLLWRDGHRVVLLSGSPEQIGAAHGKLLAAEMQRTLDSTLHLAGLVGSVQSGKWVPEELRGAWKRLAPHIPESHLREMDALADAAGIDRDTCRVGNVFPELFHCSGFALFGSATVGGKLYHGRVLDYMSQIGLHHSFCIFIVQPEGKRPFVNVGYAGFVGSVTGMNADGISLGEMGGRGEGRWDGVPMATLMRRALEECGSLDHVRRLWTDSPRTCEYFYVWADGPRRQAVGVSATPDRIEFVEPGTAHPLLGDGIADAVVLSAGSRLQALRQRVTEQHGRIDASGAMALMDRPVAMSSNLHNVLFVPEDLVFYVAHADGRRGAYASPYARYDLGELLALLEGL